MLIPGIVLSFLHCSIFWKTFGRKKMKRFLLLIYILSLALFAHGNTLAEYSDITESYEKTHSEEGTVQHIGQLFFL